MLLRHLVENIAHQMLERLPLKVYIVLWGIKGERRSYVSSEFIQQFTTSKDDVNLTQCN